MIQLIVATDRNGCIGKGNKLPFKLKHDLMNFKHVTQNTVCIMGRKTFESLKAPLQNRMNVVLTKHKEMTFNDWIENQQNEVYFVRESYIDYVVKDKHNEYSIVGGAQIYPLFEKYATKIIWTQVDTEIQGGDTFYMPSIEGYNLVSSIDYKKDSTNQYDFTIKTFVKQYE